VGKKARQTKAVPGQGISMRAKVVPQTPFRDRFSAGEKERRLPGGHRAKKRMPNGLEVARTCKGARGGAGVAGEDLVTGVNRE